MEVTYSANISQLDRPLKEAAGERTRSNEPIRIRLQPSLFRRALGQHRHWTGLSWTIDCGSVDEAVGMRKALQAFFEVLVQSGPAETQAMLERSQETH